MPELSPVKPAKKSPDALLKEVHIAAPCGESWEKMPGSDRVRSCDRCQHRVYNLSEMTSADAAELLRKSEGKICVRFYRRADGTVMTKDCPVGLQAVRKRIARATSIAFASLAVACGASFLNKERSEQPRWVQWALNSFEPEAETAPKPRPTIDLPMAPSTPMHPVALEPTMGEVAVSPSLEPRAIMGTPAPHLPEVSHSDKPYLRGLESEMQPDARLDPFVKHPRMGKVAAHPTRHRD